MREAVLRLPVVGAAARALGRVVRGRFGSSGRLDFKSSGQYWEERYGRGQNSGSGSYNHLAEFKAEILNQLVHDEGIQTVLELGCGDGNQLSLADYPQYTGFDVSETAVEICRERFEGDSSRAFFTLAEHSDQRAELALSLDVIYHLVEDEVFEDYMRRLFGSADRFVVVYSSNTDEQPTEQSVHVRHRKFTDWVERNEPGWSLVRHVPNRYPFEGDSNTGSFADFFVYARSEDSRAADSRTADSRTGD